MFSDISFTILAIVGIVLLYYGILALVYRKKAAPALYRRRAGHPAQFNQVLSPAFPHQLIDRPLDLDLETTILPFEKPSSGVEIKAEIVEDEETVLLKAAEIVVEKVQDTINNIASNPPNPEEVYSKIKAIVGQYRLFDNTEYFDAINIFIAISVERDCSIQLTKEQLLDLWK
jgi:hypothetical protein